MRFLPLRIADESSEGTFIDEGPRGWHERPLGVLLLLGLATFVALGWTTGLEFQLDDFEQIHDAARPDGPVALLGEDGPAKADRRTRPSFVAFFRPLLHLDFMADYRLFGADPFAFHATSLLWHLLAAFLLHRVILGFVRGPRRRPYALAAALVFAVHPGKWGAVSWVAARGDLMLVVFLLAAILTQMRFRERGQARYLLATFGLLIAGLLAKEGGVVGPLIVATCDFFHLRLRGRGVSWPRALRVVVPIALLAPIYLGFRRWQFGEYADFYAARHQSLTFEVIGRMFGDLVPTFELQFAGWFYYEDGSLFLRALDLYLLLLAIPWGLWVARRPVARLKFLALAALLYLVCALPALRFWREARGYEVSRVFYLPQIFPCLVLALPLANLGRAARIPRLLGLAVLVSSLVLLAPAVKNHLDAQWGASRIVERVRDDLRAIAAANPTPGIAFGVLDVPDSYARAPVYGSFLNFAMSEVFLDEAIEAGAVENKAIFLGSGRLRSLERPVQLLAWSAPDDEPTRGRLVPYGGTGVLPGPTGERPAYEVPEGAASVDFGRGLVPRDVEALALVLDRAPSEPFRLELDFEDEYRARFQIGFSLDPDRFGTTDRYLIPVGEIEDWLFRGRVLRADLSYGPEGSAKTPPARLIRIETDVTLPEIVIADPERRVSIGGEEPVYVIRDPGPWRWFRFNLSIAERPRRWTVSRDELEVLPDGGLAFRLSQPGRVRTPPALREDPLYWDDIRGDSERPSLLDLQGWRELRVRWWVEGLVGAIDPALPHHPQARSTDAVVVITR